MGLKDFFQSMSDELTLHRRRYKARRLEHPALAPYRSIRSLLAETEPRKDGKKKRVSPDGAAILCTLVDLHRRTRDRMWGAILVRAFRPFMVNLAKRLIGGTRDDRASLILVCFHEAVLRVDPHRDPPRIAMYVAQETRRGVFRELRKELDWQGVGFGEDAELCADPSAVAHPALRDTLDVQRVPIAAPAALLGTTQRRGALWAMVRHHYAALSAKEQATIYRRLQQRRRRHLERRGLRSSGDETVGSSADLASLLAADPVSDTRESGVMLRLGAAIADTPTAVDMAEEVQS